MARLPSGNGLTSKISFLFTSIMAFVYLGIGSFLLFSKKAHELSDPSFCLVMGIGLIAYGLFRCYIVYQRFKEEETFS